MTGRGTITYTEMYKYVKADEYPESLGPNEKDCLQKNDALFKSHYKQMLEAVKCQGILYTQTHTEVEM